MIIKPRVCLLSTDNVEKVSRWRGVKLIDKGKGKGRKHPAHVVVETKIGPMPARSGDIIVRFEDGRLDVFGRYASFHGLFEAAVK